MYVFDLNGWVLSILKLGLSNFYAQKHLGPTLQHTTEELPLLCPYPTECKFFHEIFLGLKARTHVISRF